MFLGAVTRLKADNPLYGSSLIDYVSDARFGDVHTQDLFGMMSIQIDLYFFTKNCSLNLVLQARIEQWIDFATLEIDANILRWFIPRIGFAVYLPPVSQTLLLYGTRVEYCHSEYICKYRQQLVHYSSILLLIYLRLRKLQLLH